MPARPTLLDVLHNRAPAPYTLPSLMSYLSANHCLETLEFSLAASQYQLSYTRALERSGGTFASRDITHLTSTWEKLLHVYLMPFAPREINIPARVKEPVLALDYTNEIPPPTALDDIIRVVHELMTDSVLGQWIDSLDASSISYLVPENNSRGRETQALNLQTSSPVPGRSASSSMERDSGVEFGDLVTPPTTPPVGGWRKMGVRLGLGASKKGRKSPTFANGDVDLPSYY